MRKALYTLLGTLAFLIVLIVVLGLIDGTL